VIIRTGFERKLQIAGILIVLGLLIELGSLFNQDNPSSFVIFMFLGGALLAIGIVYFLYSLVAPTKKN
jgi:CHASE1-domain containing sensor protein